MKCIITMGRKRIRITKGGNVRSRSASSAVAALDGAAHIYSLFKDKDTDETAAVKRMVLI